MITIATLFCSCSLNYTFPSYMSSISRLPNLSLAIPACDIYRFCPYSGFTGNLSTLYYLQYSTRRQYNSNVRRTMNAGIHILPIYGIGEILPGSDLGLIIYEALRAQELALQQGDILVVTQKIVSKAEGRIVHLEE